MSFGRFRLISQLGAGRDGVRYRAMDRESGATVDVLMLSGARDDPARWPVVARRLRTVSLIDHPSSPRFVLLDLVSSPPMLAREWSDGRSLADSGWDRLDSVVQAI